MPIVEGKYVNPGWQNDAGPAINATETNAISNTLQSLDAGGGGGGGGITVDAALSDTSTNPVQNKVITAALDDKADSDDVHSIPSGGTTGQFLVKQSATDYDAAWTTVPNANGVSF